MCSAAARRRCRQTMKSTLLLGAMLLSGGAGDSPGGPAYAATELRIAFRDGTGAPVTISKAELLLVAWGDVRRVELGGNRTSLTLPLDAEWLRSRWPERGNDVDRFYVYLQAPGYAAIRSDPAGWNGAGKGAVTAAKIRFPRGAAVTVGTGDSASVDLVFRKPVGRTLRLLDEAGDPVEGVRVSSYMFWSEWNHCGTLSGADPLGEATSDRSGRVPVADADVEYALTFQKPPWFPVKPDGSLNVTPDLPRLIMYLTSEETTLRMRRLRERPLEIRVTERGRPVQGQRLMGSLAGCPCGSCSGAVFGRNSQSPDPGSDKDGMIRAAGFYPEEWETVFFLGSDGEVLWQSDPRTWPAQGPVHVELGR